jgi:MFS family permease
MRRATLTKWVASAMVGVAFMGSGLITPLYDIYQRAFHFSELTLTLIYAAYVVGNIVALLFFGKWSDTIGRRPVAIGSIVLCALSVLFFLFAQSTLWLYVARILSGIAVGLASGTATAWLSDLDEDKSRAALIATVANGFGFGLGPIVAGVLAEYTSAPLATPFFAYLPLVIMTGCLIPWGCETIHARGKITPSLLRPRVGVPQEIRDRFIAPAITAFGTFAIVGFYAALIPTILKQSLHQAHPLAGGAIVCELAFLAAILSILARGIESRAAMLATLVLFLPSIAALILAQTGHSMLVLVIATALGGTCWALGYRGSLEVINEIAPQDRRAEVASAYYIVGFVGNSIPVIGVGLITQMANPIAASLTFGCTIAAFAIFALWQELRGLSCHPERRREACHPERRREAP